MNNLPRGWREVALGDIAKWSSGGTPKSKDSKFYGGDISWCVIGDLTEGLVYETAQTITTEGLNASSAKIVPEGTVMVAMYGASIGRVGIAAKPMATNQAIGCAVVDESQTTRWYVLYYLASQKTAFSEAGQGAAQPNISQTLLKSWELALPPLAEQERIVEILEEQFSRLDRALASIRVVREKAQVFRRSLLHSAFSGELTGGTEGWQEVPLGRVADITSGRTPNSLEARLLAKPRSDRMVPFYKVGDMNSSPKFFDTARVFLAPDELVTFRVAVIPGGSVVFPKAGGAIATNKKRIMRNEGCIDLNCMAVTARDGLLPSFLFYFFDGMDLSTLTTGSVLPQIGKKAVTDLMFPLPPLDSQERIVAVLEEQFSLLDNALKVTSQLHARVASERRTLLHAAFTGELTAKWRETHV